MSPDAGRAWCGVVVPFTHWGGPELARAFSVTVTLLFVRCSRPVSWIGANADSLRSGG